MDRRVKEMLGSEPLKGLYCRYNSWEQPSELVEEVMGSLHQQNDCLAEHIRFLHEHISELKSSLARFQDHIPELEAMKKANEKSPGGEATLPDGKVAQASSEGSGGGSEVHHGPEDNQTSLSSAGDGSRHCPGDSSKANEDLASPPSPESKVGLPPPAVKNEEPSLIEEIQDSLRYSITGSGVSFKSDGESSSNSLTYPAPSDSYLDSLDSEDDVVRFRSGAFSDSDELQDSELSGTGEVNGETSAREPGSSAPSSQESGKEEGPSEPTQDHLQLKKTSTLSSTNSHSQDEQTSEPTGTDTSGSEGVRVHKHTEPIESSVSEASVSSAVGSITRHNDKVGVLTEEQEKLAQRCLSPNSLGEFKDGLEHIPDMNLPWQPLRAVRQCSCGIAFSFSVRKFHCSFCGTVVCGTCGSNHAPLPWHVTTSKPQRVCKICFKLMKSRMRDREKQLNS